MTAYSQMKRADAIDALKTASAEVVKLRTQVSDLRETLARTVEDRDNLSDEIGKLESVITDLRLHIEKLQGEAAVAKTRRMGEAQSRNQRARNLAILKLLQERYKTTARTARNEEKPGFYVFSKNRGWVHVPQSIINDLS